MLNIFRRCLLFLVCILLWGCNHNTEKTTADTKNKYSLFISDSLGEKFLIETNNLDNGIVEPDKENILNNIEGIHREMIVHHGYYFRLNAKTKEFTKYKNVGNKLAAFGSFPLDNFYIENYIWITDDSLIIFDTNIKEHPGHFDYVKVDTRSMKFKTGKLPIPVLANIVGSSIGFSKMTDKGNILMGYSFHDKQQEEYHTLDTAYIAVLSYPALQVQKIGKTVKSTYPGGENAVEPSTFTTENGDFYFLTCPGVAMGNSPEKPTALFRIKKGKEEIDSSYFFNISASSINNHAYTIYYLGNDIALIRNERKDLFTKSDKHWKVHQFEFHLVNIATGTVIKKLQLPLDKGTRRQCVIQEGSIVYISINSKEGNFIWNYNLKTDKLQKGLQLAAPTDYILRMDKLN